MQAISQQKIGLNCPVCKEFIPITILQIISSGHIVCPYCELKLEVDKEASSQAIDALGKVQNAQNHVQQSSNSLSSK